MRYLIPTQAPLVWGTQNPRARDALRGPPATQNPRARDALRGPPALESHPVARSLRSLTDKGGPPAFFSVARGKPRRSGCPLFSPRSSRLRDNDGVRPVSISR